MTEFLDFGLQMGREAGQRLLDWRNVVLKNDGDPSTVQVKQDGSVITEADRAIDRYICQQIRGRYPQHGIISEESSTAYEGRRFTWVIDPLDGTTNFALGLAYWGCSIALIADGQPLLGVVVMPMLGTEFWAVRGQGAFCDGEPMKNGSSQRSGLTERHSFLAICSRSWKYLDLPLPYKGRLLGSAVYDLAAVAQGLAKACTQVTSHIWDVAAGYLLVQEAGGTLAPLLPDAPEPFPLVHDTDYRDRVFPLAAGVDAQVVESIVTKLTIKPKSQERFRMLSAAGWDAKVWRARRG